MQSQCLILQLQNKMNDAKQRGDILEQGQAGLDLQKFMKEKNISPFRNAIPLFAQGVVFLSFMGALRGMSNCPVPSLTSGGLLWFTDFTEMDPYFALPILTSCAIMLQVGSHLNNCFFMSKIKNITDETGS